MNEIGLSKDKIMYSLQKNGQLDNIKAYLRSNIITNLKKDETESVKIKKVLYEYDIDKIKQLKLTSSLILDFLKRYNMNYTASVFLPELGLSDLYTEPEIAKICNITYDNLYKEEETSYLNLIIKKVTQKQIKESKETQTERETKIIKLDEKLKEIDDKYNKQIDLLPAKTIEEKMFKFQRECEARFRSDSEREINRIKEIEISQMRIEENRKYMKKIEEIREDYDKEYNEKLEYIKKREIELNQRINYKEKEIEQRLYDNNQKFQDQILLLKMKEDELKKKLENEIGNIRLQEDKLRFKESELNQIKDSYMKRFNEEVEHFKLEYERKFEIEKNEFNKRKLLIEEREFRNSLFEEKMKKLEFDNDQSIKNNLDLTNEIKQLQSLYNNLKKENDVLREELKILSDNEKRHSEALNNKIIEAKHLKSEIDTMKDVINNQKCFIDDRKADHAIIIDNLKKQLNENSDRYEKSKNEYEKEINKIKGLYLNLLQKEKKDNYIKEIMNDKDRPKVNNYVSRDNNLNWQKLEKEAEELKKEINYGLTKKESNSTSDKGEKYYLDMYEKLLKENRNIMASNETMNINMMTILSNMLNNQIHKANDNNNHISTTFNKPIENKEDLNNKEKKINKSNENILNIISNRDDLNSEESKINNPLIKSEEIDSGKKELNYIKELLDDNKKDIRKEHNYDLDNKYKHEREYENKDIKKENEFKSELPTPIIVTDNKNSNRDYEYNENFSIGNITSSNEWTESNRKSNKIKDTPKMNDKINISKKDVSNNSIKEEIEESRDISKHDKIRVDSSYNKFNTVNLEIDKNSDDEIKTEQESENYGDFDIDIDNLDNKPYKLSVENDILKNTSFNASARLGKSNNRSQSLEARIERMMQSKSGQDEIEEEISIDNSSKKKSIAVEEESSLKYKDYYNTKSIEEEYNFDNNVSNSKREISRLVGSNENNNDAYEPVEYD